MSDYVIVLGATATGKSRWALALAEEHGGEIVNADAFQMYRGLDIGTAKPGVAERSRAPHHLIDILDPEETFSAGAFAGRAAAAIERVHSAGRLPIVVGGTGLYLRTLTAGLSPVPPTPPEVRAAWKARLADEGLAALRERLERDDPRTAALLEAADAQRTVRALEVLEMSGVPLAEWWERPRRPATRLIPRKFGLTVPKALLYDRILKRVVSMMEAGWVEEVRKLLARGVAADSPAFRAIGYRWLAENLDGEPGLAVTVETIAGETRRYAKRQGTWFRRESNVEWIEGASVDLSHRVGLLEG